MKTVLISDESLNSYGFYLSTKGADLKQFKKNPILLFMHQRGRWAGKESILPIGTVENVRIEGDQVLGDPVFDLDDEFAAKIASKWEKGILKMVSPGLKIIERSEDPKLLKQGQTRATVTKWKLKELSVVDIASNDNALALYDDEDKLINLSNDPDQEIPIPKLKKNQNNNQMDTIKLSDDTELTVADVEKLHANSKTHTVALSDMTGERDALNLKLKGFEDKEAEAQKTEATQLLDAAVKDGRIDATPKENGKSARDNWQTLFDTNHENAKLALASTPQRTAASKNLSDSGTGKEREELEKLSWDELNEQNKLETLKENHFDLFEAKFKEKYKCELNK